MSKLNKVKMPAGRYWVGDPCYVLSEENVANFDWVDNFCEPLWKAEEAVGGGRGRVGVIDWGDDFCEPLSVAEKASGGGPVGVTVEVQGYKVFASSTAYGDGCYPSSIGFVFGVDAGLIGLVPVELVPEEVGDRDLCTLVEFDEDFVCYYDNGTIVMGDLYVYTGDSDDEEEYDYDEE